VHKSITGQESKGDGSDNSKQLGELITHDEATTLKLLLLKQTLAATKQLLENFADSNDARAIHSLANFAPGSTSLALQ
jgi:hypothetical protein